MTAGVPKYALSEPFASGITGPHPTCYRCSWTWCASEGWRLKHRSASCTQHAADAALFAALLAEASDTAS